MIDFSKYVLLNEICIKTNKQFIEIMLHKDKKNPEAKYMLDGVCLVRKECIKKQYHYLFEDCIDMNRYRPMSYLSRMLGRCKNYLYSKNKERKIKTIKIGRRVFVKLPDDFINLLKQGKIPYMKGDYEQWSEDMEVIKFYGMKVGFY